MIPRYVSDIEWCKILEKGNITSECWFDYDWRDFNVCSPFYDIFCEINNKKLACHAHAHALITMQQLQFPPSMQSLGKPREGSTWHEGNIEWLRPHELNKTDLAPRLFYDGSEAGESDCNITFYLV